MRVDHVENYRLPKHLMEKEEGIEASKQGPGHAYSGQELASEFTLEKGQDLFAPVQETTSESNRRDDGESKDAKRKRKEERQLKREEKEEHRRRKDRKRTEREERKREKRARKMQDGEGEERHSKKGKKHSRSDSQSSSTRS